MAAISRSRRPLALAAAVAVALGAGALAVTSASAAEAPLKDYELTWGIKQSYRSYVTGMAAGSFTPAGGATQAADNGAFTFVRGSGTYDSDTHAVRLGFEGGLTIASKLHGFELTLSDVKFDSGAAEITADVTSGGSTRDDVPLADVTVTRTMTGMETKLTEEAATVLGSASYAGAAGDPLTVVQKTSPTQSPSPTASPSSTSPKPTASTPSTASPSASQPASPSASASETGAATKGDIADGTLGWGVKQSFRTYVVDGPAQGRITASGGATQASGNGVFAFGGADGSYDTDAGTLTAAFKGAVNFKGHEANGTYGLDLTLSGLAVELDGGTGELTADVESLGKASDDVVLAKLTAATSDLKAEDDVLTLDDVTAELTKAGAQAFGGFYTEGTVLDPVDLSVALSDDAQLPDGDGDGDSGNGSGTDSGSGGTGTTSGTSGGTGTTGSTTGGVTGALASTGSDVPAGALGAAAAVTVAAGAGVVIAVRRRRQA